MLVSTKNQLFSKSYISASSNWRNTIFVIALSISFIADNLFDGKISRIEVIMTDQTAPYDFTFDYGNDFIRIRMAETETGRILSNVLLQRTERGYINSLSFLIKKKIKMIKG